jgi:sulfite reductase (NADPH) flavoprotein alpha-component
MLRSLHRWPGLIAAAFLIVLALSGAALSLYPAMEHLSSPQATAGLDLATLTARIEASHPAVEQIKRAPSGQITASWITNGEPSAAVIDPATGQDAGSADASRVEVWLTDLHRALFLGDNGRIATGIAALAMTILAASGMALVARRMGGWKRWFAPARGPWAGRIHVQLTRFAVAGLLLSSLTALWMTASTFGYLPDAANDPLPPATTSGQTGFDAAKLPLLAQTQVAGFREFTYPYPDDAQDVFTLKTDAGTTLFDQGNGAILAQSTPTTWEKISETIYMLHTGKGAATLGLILGLMALGLPAMAVTGIVLYLSGRRTRGRIKANAPAGSAETILLVASENGSTWGFAANLHASLRAAGHKVHAAPLAAFDPAKYLHARRIVIFAATYGDGEAPSSAKGFLAQLSTAQPQLPLAILGFGDRNFASFCGFAEAIASEAIAQGWPELIPLDTIDRQSAQDFARWGRAFGHALRLPLELTHQIERPATQSLRLIARQDYGAEVQAPTAILRFALPEISLLDRLLRRGFARFSAGDLLGILPAGADLPRLYSLASARRDGFVEICVRKHAGGLCSGQLLDLEPGESVQAFLRPNPSFRPAKGTSPVILIGAGTGIGPLAGFIRANTRHRPMHLFFGARHPDSDFLYDIDLSEWGQSGQLSSLTTAFSRTAERHFVQTALRRDADRLSRLIAEGAQILVCGGRDMAAGVAAALADILAPQGLTPALLKAKGRYLEDVY